MNALPTPPGVDGYTPCWLGGRSLNAALGNSWYDSFQTKVTKRYSHGMDLTAAFTWQKELTLTGSFNDPVNRTNQKRLAGGATPFVFVTGFNYEVRKQKGSRLLNAVASGWTIGGLLRLPFMLPPLVKMV